MTATSTMRLAPYLLLGVLTTAHCFSPTISEGVMCGADNSCPAGMQCDPFDGRCRFELLGLGEDLRVFPESFQFGSVVQGNSSSPSTFTVVNLGLDPSKPLNVSLRGSDQFAIANNDCQGVELPREGSCTFTGLFAPRAAGTQSSTLTVSDTANTTVSVVTGTGLALGDLLIQPANLNYAAQTVGTSSAEQELTVRNIGSSPTGLLSVSIENTASFTIAMDDCSDMALQSESSCKLQVSFQPPLAGTPVTSILVSAEPGGASSASIGGVGKATLAVTHNGTEGGTVVSSPTGILCGSDCSAEFSVDTVTLTALSADGAIFDNWQGAPQCSTATTCEVKMDIALRTITAEWLSCKEGDFLRCANKNTIVLCGSSDNQELSQGCAFGCNSGAKRCNECAPGTNTCEGQTVVMCTDQGLRGASTVCPGSCSAGACVGLNMQDAGPVPIGDDATN